jgi:hypothetical protein
MKETTTPTTTGLSNGIGTSACSCGRFLVAASRFLVYAPRGGGEPSPEAGSGCSVAKRMKLSVIQTNRLFAGGPRSTHTSSTCSHRQIVCGWASVYAHILRRFIQTGCAARARGLTAPQKPRPSCCVSEIIFTTFALSADLGYSRVIPALRRPSRRQKVLSCSPSASLCAGPLKSRAGPSTQRLLNGSSAAFHASSATTRHYT